MRKHLVIWILVLLLLTSLGAGLFFVSRTENLRNLWLPEHSRATSTAVVVAPKALIVTMFQLGDPLNPESQGEATIWVQEHQLTRKIEIPGAYSPLYCDQAEELCLVVTGVGTTNATMTMMALGLSDRLDMQKTYLLVAGIAGISPNVATIESVVWVEWVVDVSVIGEYDAREMPEDFDYPKFPYGCANPDCTNPFRMGTEFYQINPILTEWGYNLTKDLPLEESQSAIMRREKYPQETANRSPEVVKCSIAGGNNFWHGKLMSDWASWWIDRWTEGKSPYCVTSVEEPGIAPVVYNLGKFGRLDPQRLMIIRVGSNFDQQNPTQTVEESLSAALSGVEEVVGMHNLHLVGWTVLDYILEHWLDWENGIPSAP